MIKRILVLSLLVTSLVVFINACGDSSSDKKYGAEDPPTPPIKQCCSIYNKAVSQPELCFGNATECPLYAIPLVPNIYTQENSPCLTDFFAVKTRQCECVPGKSYIGYKSDKPNHPTPCSP